MKRLETDNGTQNHCHSSVVLDPGDNPVELRYKVHMVTQQLGAVFLLAILLVSGCALFDTSLDYPRKGEFLILHQPLTIPADTTGLYIQDGVVSGGGHSRFEPYCEFRVRKLKEIPQVIQPDAFQIIRSRGNTRIVDSKPVQLATIRLSSGTSGDDGPSDIIETRELKLYSANQPDVILLDCGGAEDIPGYAVAPGRAEIQRALGKIATISLQPPS